MSRAQSVSDRGWDLIIPVKRLDAAKSRLGGLEPAYRQRLALSFAIDAVEAARSASLVARVLIVTADPQAAAELSLRGAVLVGETRGPGLNPAIEAGIAAATDPDPLRRLAVMTADLPAVSAEEIDAALASAQAHRLAVLPDAEAIGTVLLTANPFTAPEAPSPVRLRPLFGEGSFALHAAAGHVPLTGDHPGLRRDVDTREDLENARLLGVGRMTGQALSVAL